MKTPSQLSLTPDCRGLQGKAVPLQSQSLPETLLACDHPQGTMLFRFSPIPTQALCLSLCPLARLSRVWPHPAHSFPLLQKR